MHVAGMERGRWQKQRGRLIYVHAAGRVLRDEEVDNEDDAEDEDEGDALNSCTLIINN